MFWYCVLLFICDLYILASPFPICRPNRLILIYFRVQNYNKKTKSGLKVFVKNSYHSLKTCFSFRLFTIINIIQQLHITKTISLFHHELFFLSIKCSICCVEGKTPSAFIHKKTTSVVEIVYRSIAPAIMQLRSMKSCVNLNFCQPKTVATKSSTTVKQCHIWKGKTTMQMLSKPTT